MSLSKKYKKIYIGGTFDLTHYGHFELFKRAKQLAEKVVVALNTDEFNERYKGGRPILTLEERKRSIIACKWVDKVDVNDGCEDSKPAILRNKPNAILHGDDWAGESLAIQMGLTKEFLEKNKIKMVYVPYTSHISSTIIKERIKVRKKTCQRIITIDLDNTLCKGVCWSPEDCLKAKPNKSLIAKINKLYHKDITIIYTARRDYLMSATVVWLRKHGVRYWGISNQKLHADIYIDKDSQKSL